MNYLKQFIRTCFFTFFLIFIFGTAFPASGIAASRDYYQIQVYRLSGKVQAEKVDNFLKNAYLPALHRAGIKNVGVFKPVEKDTLNKNVIYVWIPFKSIDHFVQLQDDLAKDKEYQAKGIDFLGAPFDQAPFLRKESILLKAFPDAPNHFIPRFTTGSSEKIYELRSYEGPTENLFRQKTKMFNEGGEIKLFNSLDFNTVFNAEVISGSTMPNLMYMTSFENMASHDAHWKAFGSHPEWKRLSGLEEYKNTVSKAVIILMHPTDYSDF